MLTPMPSVQPHTAPSGTTHPQRTPTPVHTAMNRSIEIDSLPLRKLAEDRSAQAKPPRRNPVKPQDRPYIRPAVSRDRSARAQSPISISTHAPGSGTLANQML